MAVNPDILCLNYLDYKKNIAGIIKSAEKKLIVIDNADDIEAKELSVAQRKHYA